MLALLLQGDRQHHLAVNVATGQEDLRHQGALNKQAWADEVALPQFRALPQTNIRVSRLEGMEQQVVVGIEFRQGASIPGVVVGLSCKECTSKQWVK